MRKSNAKNRRGLGRERRLIFLWLVSFSRRGTDYDVLTSLVYVFNTESHMHLARNASHLSCFVPNVISKDSTEPNQRMSQHTLQETGILVPVGSGAIDY